jgi:hypothetical protein
MKSPGFWFLAALFVAAAPPATRAGLDPAAAAPPPTAVITTSLNATATTRAIQACGFLARETVLPEVEMRLNTAEKAMDQLHTRVAASNDAATKSAFETAYIEVRTRQKVLHDSLAAAIRVRDKSDWDAASSALAHAYEAYANAVAQAEAAGKIYGQVSSEP